MTWWLLQFTCSLLPFPFHFYQCSSSSSFFSQNPHLSLFSKKETNRYTKQHFFPIYIQKVNKHLFIILFPLSLLPTHGIPFLPLPPPPRSKTNNSAPSSSLWPSSSGSITPFGSLSLYTTSTLPLSLHSLWWNPSHTSTTSFSLSTTLIWFQVSFSSLESPFGSSSGESPSSMNQCWEEKRDWRRRKSDSHIWYLPMHSSVF